MWKIIKRKANILIQIESNDAENVTKIVKICEKLDYDIIFVTLRSYNKYLRILEKSEPVILRKTIVKGTRNIPEDFDMVSARAVNRFVLNKLIRAIEIDSIVVDVENRCEVPSKDQLKIIKEEGKAVEILLKIDKLLDIKYLRSLETFLNQCVKCGVTFFLYVPVRDAYDVKCPYDVYSVVELLCNADSRFIGELKVRQLQFLSDLFYRRGLELRLLS
ncbi:MAG: hypothetical protein GXO23_07820 [Crenarchaeota archaeon]|nr:hypothetical protein [Thermoproteota archaeon]